MKKILLTALLICALTLGAAGTAFAADTTGTALKNRFSGAVTIGVGLPTGGVEGLNTALVKNTYILLDLGDGWGAGFHYGGSDYDAEAIDQLDNSQYGLFATYTEENAFGKGVDAFVKLEGVTSQTLGTDYKFGPLAGVGIAKQVSKSFQLIAGADWFKIPLPDKITVVDGKPVVEPQESITQYGIHAGLVFTPKPKEQ